MALLCEVIVGGSSSDYFITRFVHASQQRNNLSADIYLYQLHHVNTAGLLCCADSSNDMSVQK